MKEMLKVENLTVYYGYVSALQKVNLQVNEGEIITLIGGNGAGKTTTLMSISNLVEKTEGRITFKGQDITNLAPDKIVKLGISHVPEGRKIFPQLTVYENLIAGTFGRPGMSKDRVQELMEQSFTLFPRLKERTKQAGGSLSGGEQQMLAIARGLMMDPSLIMLDEPSLGLAPIIVEEIFELILRIRETGTTVLLIEQNASMALSIADRGYVLETGRMTLTGTGKELSVNEDVKKAYLGA
jgi:branched-chain amino acid transport system ATP-binding protein